MVLHGGVGTVNHNRIFQGAYTAWGYRGQFITILPKLDVVIAIKTKDIYQRITSWEQYFTIS